MIMTFFDRLEDFCNQLHQEIGFLDNLSKKVSSVSVSIDGSFSMENMVQDSNKVALFRYIVREVLPVKQRILNDAVCLVSCASVIRDGELKKLKDENDVINERFMGMFGESLMIEEKNSTQKKS